MPTSKKSPAKAPATHCPFTGAPIEIKEVAGGTGWMASVGTPDGGWFTSIFGRKDELLYFLGMREGVRPLYPKHEEVQTSEIKSPDSGVEAEQKAEEQIHEHAREAVDSLTQS